VIARALDYEFSLAPGWKAGVPPEKAAAREKG